MDTINGKNLRDGSKIYREQLITIEDLETFKADLLNEIKKLLQPGTTHPGRKEVLKPLVATLRSDGIIGIMIRVTTLEFVFTVREDFGKMF